MQRNYRSYKASHEPGRKIPDEPVLTVKRTSARRKTNPVMDRINARRRAQGEARRREGIKKWRDDIRERESMGLKRKPSKRQRIYLVHALGFSHLEVSSLSMGEATDIIDGRVKVVRNINTKKGFYLRRARPMWIKKGEE
jgi:hypothetical protein